jgi:hypothetical protein
VAPCRCGTRQSGLRVTEQCTKTSRNGDDKPALVAVRPSSSREATAPVLARKMLNCCRSTVFAAQYCATGA